MALCSGGKDSCYNMLLCQHYGHEIVALANLLPVQAETDDLDSFMYQTVGHQVIAAYAECMGLPLYRRRITGASHEQRLVYEDTTGDEVEDLYCLLAWVKERHPGVQAVASGAIASDYQRTRVERVCARLGLVSLAFLWHQPQGTLLARMIDASVEAILVKVAAAGLTPWRHLGAPLAVLPANLAALRRRYGINICGEGGEYETLTLDCPLFTRGRILLDGWETVVVSEDSLAPVALLHPTAFHVEPKQQQQEQQQVAHVEPKQQQQERQQVAHGSSSGVGSGGGGFEKALAVEQAAGTQGRVVEVPDDFHPAEAGSPPAAPTAGVTPAAEAAGNIDAQLHVTEGIQFLTLTAEVPAPSGDPSSCCTTVDAAAALIAALQLIQQSLPGLGLTWRHSLFVHLYVPSMAAFVAANAAYSLFFPAVNPPSRATVELSANPELALVVEVLFARAPELRRVLHVQSISEWAPSCIGPYSQALQHAGLVSFAGQIGLHPPTMEVLSGGLEAQCVRCLASCQAVAVAMRTDLPRSILWCTVYCSEAAGPTGWQQAQAHLAAFLLGQLDTSLLLQPASRLEQGAGGGNSRQQRAAAEQEQRQALGQPGRQGSGVAGASGGGSSSEGEGSDLDEEPEQELDDYLRPPAMRRHWQPLLTLVTVPQLPRGVLVEIQPVACVVDATAEDPSPPSSSDSEPDDGQPSSSSSSSNSRRRGSRRQQQQGSMPGWIGRLQERQVEGCRSIFSPGRLCRAQATLDGSTASAEQLQQAARGLAEALAAAQLSVTDLASLKAYCLASQLGSQVTAAELRHCLSEALPGSTAAAAVVPVVAVGRDASGGSACVLLELLAHRHP